MNLNNTPCVRRSVFAAAALALGLLGQIPAAGAASVTVNFTGTVSSASGDFTAVTGNVAGSFTYDSVPGTDLSANPSIGLYSFSGAPYGFSVQIDGFGTLDGTSLLAQTGDDGAVLPGFDTFQLAGTDGNYESRIDWSGSTASFSGEGIPDMSVLQTMNPLFVIRNTASGQNELLANLDTLAFSPVPLPPAVWLLATGGVLLTGIGRRRARGN